MKLIYWVAECEDDSTAYSIREKTRKEVIARLEEVHYGLKKVLRGKEHGDSYKFGCYSDAHKVEIEYDSIFELAQTLLSEFRDAHESSYNNETKYVWVKK